MTHESVERTSLSVYQRPQVRHWNGSCVQIFFGVSRICREREGGRSEGERASIKKWVIPSSLGIAEGRAKWRKSAPGEALPSRVTSQPTTNVCRPSQRGQGCGRVSQQPGRPVSILSQKSVPLPAHRHPLGIRHRCRSPTPGPLDRLVSTMSRGGGRLVSTPKKNVPDRHVDLLICRHSPSSPTPSLMHEKT